MSYDNFYVKKIHKSKKIALSLQCQKKDTQLQNLC